MNLSRETLNKSERLCSIKVIKDLFENGEIFYSPLCKVVWQKSPASIPFPAQIAFSVTKRGFRHAIVRNLIKRRMRESYRRNKSFLYKHLISTNKQIVFVVIFRDKNIPDYSSTENAIKEVINKLIYLTK
jgi:ribonuclease P protein component